MKLTRTINYAAHKLKANAPRLLTVAGIVGIPVSIFMACKATRKLDETLEECKIDRTDNRSLAASYANAGLKLGKLYAPTAVVAGASMFCILKSDKIDQKNYALLTAGYEALYASYLKYRENNKILNGDESDRECSVVYRKTDYDVEDLENPGAFKPALDCYSISDTARFFDEYSERFDEFKDKESRMQFVLNSKNWVLKRLRRYNFVTAYDYYKYLGIPNLTETLKLYGWEYGDEVIINDWASPHMADFINLREDAVLLDPNFKFMPPIWSYGLEQKYLDEYQQNCLDYWKECNNEY